MAYHEYKEFCIIRDLRVCKSVYLFSNDKEGLIWKRNVKFKRFSEENQINTDIELIPTQKPILNSNLYNDNNGEET